MKLPAVLRRLARIPAVERLDAANAILTDQLAAEARGGSLSEEEIRERATAAGIRFEDVPQPSPSYRPLHVAGAP